MTSSTEETHMGEVIVTPESYKTSTVTPIKLSQTERTETIFAVKQVDNHRNMKKNLKGTLIIKKTVKDGPSFGEPEKFSRRSIKYGEWLRLPKETYALGKGFLTIIDF